MPDFDFGEDEKEEVVQEIPQAEPPLISITDIDRYGLMRLSFSEPMIVPTNFTEVINSTVFDI